jgi:hypothetical protein
VGGAEVARKGGGGRKKDIEIEREKAREKKE